MDKQLMKLASSDGCSVYQLKNETGEGTFTLYQVFPGVTLGYNDIHMRYYDSDLKPANDVFCIDHCREGRMEYQRTNEAYSYVQAGDLKLDRRLTHSGRFDFPLSHYHGLMIGFDMDVAQAALPDEIRGFPVDLKQLQEKYCPGKYPHVIRGTRSIEHIFSEIYAVPQEIKLPYFKIKVLELLLFLQALNLPKEEGERPYFYKTDVEKIKAISVYLADNLNKDITQEDLSDKYDMPLTSMKQCFKAVFGMSIGAWRSQYRMNRAAELLRGDRDLSVTEIAGMVGYDSPSKFAIAFRKVMNVSPTEYRGAIR